MKTNNKNKRVLVVDDSMIMRQIIINIFNDLDGYEVVAQADNGKVAVEKYLETLPDIVTMDITMSGYNGITGLKDIIFQDKDAKVIMITAHGEESLIMDAIDIGAVGYILKPLTKEVLKAQIEKIKFKGNKDV